MVETIARRLREVTVRPAVGADERLRWDALMGAHHYLPFRGLVGRSVRHVAVLGELWLALIGWHAGAFKLKTRDRWIGWLPEQQFVRLHLIANNARFLILPECAAANLASRVLGLSLRRLSGDFHALHGHPILIAETFVDRSRFTGACYRAANWQVLGQTRGFARKPGTPATWVPHGRPKEVLVYPLARDAREQLCRLDDAPKWRSEGDRGPLIDCEACGSVCMACPIFAAHAVGAIRWPPSWPSRSPRSLPDTTARPRPGSSLKA